MKFSHDQNTLTVTCETGAVTIDLTSSLRATLYNLPEARDITVDEFTPRLVQPLESTPGGTTTDGLRLQLVNEEHGLFIPVEFLCCKLLHLRCYALSTFSNLVFHRRIFPKDGVDHF